MQKAFPFLQTVSSYKEQQQGQLLNHLFFELRKSLFTGAGKQDAKITS